MGTLPINFPKPGSKVTYREAIEAYDALVRQSIKLVYSEHFSPCAGAYDLLRAIEGAAEKYGVYDSEEIVALRRSLRGFSANEHLSRTESTASVSISCRTWKSSMRSTGRISSRSESMARSCCRISRLRFSSFARRRSSSTNTPMSTLESQP